jgi:hypothetical protein
MCSLLSQDRLTLYLVTRSCKLACLACREHPHQTGSMRLKEVSSLKQRPSTQTLLARIAVAWLSSLKSCVRSMQLLSRKMSSCKKLITKFKKPIHNCMRQIQNCNKPMLSCCKRREKIIRNSENSLNNWRVARISLL